MDNKAYNKLFEIFKSYEESDWYKLITEVFEYKQLNLPVDIENEHPQETFIFIDVFLRNHDKNIADFYVKNLIDYYSTLNNILPNIKYFKIFHSIFATIKPTKYRYVLEYKLTKEDFLNSFPYDLGQDLQIDLISTLSNLRYVKDETTTSYLFNNISKYSSEFYILISLRYFQRSSDVPSYYEYLNQLIDEKFNTNNATIFINSFKELIFQKRSFKILYDWFTKFNTIKQEQLEVLNSKMRGWINYSNKYMIDKNYPYAKLLFFQINKEHIIPCYTLKNICNYIRRIPEIRDNIEEYIRKSSLLNENLIFNEWQKLLIYRIPRIPSENILRLDIDKIPDSYLQELSEMYLLDENKILSAELSEEELDILYPIIYTLRVIHIKEVA